MGGGVRQVRRGAALEPTDRPLDRPSTRRRSSAAPLPPSPIDAAGTLTSARAPLRAPGSTAERPTWWASERAAGRAAALGGSARMHGALPLLAAARGSPASPPSVLPAPPPPLPAPSPWPAQCFNCVDRHVAGGAAGRTAFYWEGNDSGTATSLTYGQLQRRVCQARGGRRLGAWPGWAWHLRPAQRPAVLPSPPTAALKPP